MTAARHSPHDPTVVAQPAGVDAPPAPPVGHGALDSVPGALPGHQSIAPRSDTRGSSVAGRLEVWLVAPLAFYLVPLLAGFGWTMFGPGTPRIPFDAEPVRIPDTAITIEGFGTSVVVVPLLARMRSYLLAGELPLWNPYQGLGQPFAAQGDGSPYFPLAIVRALLPYDLGGYVTVATFLLGGVFTVLLLRELGLSPIAAGAGGAMVEVSGALSLHVARFNIADQLCMVPVLFWSTARAARARTPGRFIVLAMVAGLHAVAGFVQTAMIAGLVAGLFGVALAWAEGDDRDARARRVLGIGLATLVGNGLAAFHLLPMADAIQGAFNVRGSLQGFLTVPQTNGLAFFFPHLFGPYFASWLRGDLPVVDWNNLYGFAGTGPLLLTLLGARLVDRTDARRRFAFIFFAVAGTFLLLRYLVFPPVAGINLLPILGHQTPKHATGLIALCYIFAAAVALDMLRLAPERRFRPWFVVLLLAVASSVVTVVASQGGMQFVAPNRAQSYLLFTVILVGGLAAACWTARRWRTLDADRAAALVGCAVVAELASYIPLGTNRPEVLLTRAACFVGIVAGGLLLVTGRRWLGAGMTGLVLIGYAAVVVLPPGGLPSRVDALSPPRFMRWLGGATGTEYRTLGIAPDFSSVGAVQDLGVVGPFSPHSYASFVRIVAPDPVWRNFERIGTFWVTTGFLVREYYDLGDYLRTKPVFDWLGVRYVVLDRDSLREGQRSDHLPLLAGANGLRMAYEDEHVAIVESPAAAPKAEFWTSVQVLPDTRAVIQALRDDPALVRGRPLVASSYVADRLGRDRVRERAGEQAAAPASSEGPLPATVETYGPNRVRLAVDAPEPGLLVLKDAAAPGWQARLDGADAEIVDVNAMVRGVVVPTAGRHAVELVYRPASLTWGLAISGACALVIAGLTVRAYYGQQSLARRWRGTTGTRRAISERGA